MKILDTFRLDGQAAIVTGAGRGIGQAIALAYAEAGADVVCAARTLSEVEATAARIRALGRRAVAVSCDVTNFGQLGRLVDAAMTNFDRITHLVNNAGGTGPNDPLTTTPETFENVLRFNLTSACELTRLCVPYMRESGGGNVLNITSVAARYAQRHFSAYGTAKAALTQLTRLLAQDFAPIVRVNAVSPGPILTDSLAGVLTGDMRQGMEHNTPMKCLGEPRDIAAAALYLASPASRWVTGKIIEVDGGADSTVWPG
ncbi:MAG TPA: glucose 1-dehydrogenase [Aromatoleum sp.]|uniref:glucose 1-dehydrogenase n=1 Tax=Aromatoleum sp. TaxID=2307007 RepID=UPI002B488CA7|nr:glucose 1-dehydrogenase [Aromatoleum sp.]HJV27680.1 glucose 1-dehydrogenase [Aromatoleum sp.]